MELALGDDARKKLEIPSQKESIEAGLEVHADPKRHFHIWIERGWKGSTSPAYASVRLAGEAIRRLAEEPWCEGTGGSEYFPFEQVFLKRKDGGPALTAVLKECRGPDKGIGMGIPCNKEATWR